MIICSNCGEEITKKVSKCPNCHAKLPKDSIEPLPSVINNPEKITSEETLNEKNLKINTIPIKVKKATAPKNAKNLKKDQNDKKPKRKKASEHIASLQTKSTLKIIAVAILLVQNITLIVNIAIKTETNNNQAMLGTKKNANATTNAIGSWKTENNSLFVFTDDYNFYWYDSYKSLDNNYYAGTYNLKKGEEALTEMGYTEEEFATTFGNDIELDNVYSMNLLPTLSYKNYQDTSSSDLKENESWWFILIIKNDDTAIAYNKTLDLRYNLNAN